MNFGHLLSVMAARWKLSVFVLLAVVSAGVALSQLMPQRYEAKASMLVEVGKTAPDPLSRGGLIGLEQKIYMATQVELLSGERVARAVAKSLKPEYTAHFKELWLEGGGKGDFGEWVATTLNRNLTILPSRESNVIEVTYKGSSPELAADIANAFIARYMDIAVELRVQSAQQYLSFFQQQADEHRVKLEKARAALTRFQQSRGILGADDRQDVESSRLADLSREVTMLEAQLAEFTGRDAQARQRGDQMREVTADPVIVAMRTDLARMRTELSQAQQTLGDNHPKILELRRSIADQSARLERETVRVTSGVALERNVIVQRLASLRAALEQQRKKVATLSEARSEASMLIADVESAQLAYDNVLKSLNQMRLESQATQGNATLLEAALPPTRPSSPNVPLIVAASVFLGTLFGILTGLVRELFDRRIRTESQLEVLVDQPLLVAVPSFAGRKGKALTISSRRALSGHQRRLPGT